MEVGVTARASSDGAVANHDGRVPGEEATRRLHEGRSR